MVADHHDAGAHRHTSKGNDEPEQQKPYRQSWRTIGENKTTQVLRIKCEQAGEH